MFYWQGRKTNAEACIQTYKRTCSQLGNYPPQQKIIDTMDKPMMSLSSRSLGPTAIKPLCIALKASTYIQNNMISFWYPLISPFAIYRNIKNYVFYTFSIKYIKIHNNENGIVIKVARNIMFYNWFLMLLNIMLLSDISNS